MSAMPAEEPDDLDDLLPDDLLPATAKPKGKAKPIRRSKALAQRSVAQIEADRLKAEKDAQKLRDQAAAAQLAQIVNLHIAGISLSEIGARIGCTADEIDRMLQQDAQRYVRSQPALRVYVRNFVSAKYSELLEAVWTEATDRGHAEKLENLREARGILDKMARLHGAEAPVQTEVKVETAPESIDKMVAALAAQAGRAYDMSIFDDDDEEIYDGEVEEVGVDDVVSATSEALEVSGNAVGETQPEDEEFGNG